MPDTVPGVEMPDIQKIQEALNQLIPGGYTVLRLEDAGGPVTYVEVKPNDSENITYEYVLAGDHETHSSDYTGIHVMETTEDGMPYVSQVKFWVNGSWVDPT
jgi:hypothetical protein